MSDIRDHVSVVNYVSNYRPCSGMICRLLESSAAGNITTVKKLLRAKVVDPDVKDELHHSALTLACKGGHYYVVKLLLDAGANPNATTSNLVTPLHIAAQNGDERLIKLLLVHGASMQLTNRNGLVPVDHLPHGSGMRKVFVDAKKGVMPKVEEPSDVCVIPAFAIIRPEKPPKKKKKGGKKKGGKKKGGKKKKT